MSSYRDDSERTKRISREYDRYSPWFWVDIETSGLDVATSDVLEIAVVVTDASLDVWDSLHLVIHHDINVLMMKSSSWCKHKFSSRSYGGNGLFDACHYSTTTMTDAIVQLITFFDFYSSHEIGKTRPIPNERKFFDRTSSANGMNLSPYDLALQAKTKSASSDKKRQRQVLLAGSTVTFDRQVIDRHFPVLKKYLSHKSIDVTTLLETAKRFRPDLLAQKPKPNATHRAIDDIIDSINLYRFFRGRFFS